MRGHLKPLTLKALESGCLTGYDIAKFVEEKTGKKPSSGSLYPLIDSMEKENLINSKEDGNKKILCLTKEGKKEAKRVDNIKQLMLKKLEESMKMFESIHNCETIELHRQVLKRMKADKMDLIIFPELEKLKHTILTISLNESNIAKKKKMAAIIKKANTELKKIKNGK